jgi:hypothetical protein
LPADVLLPAAALAQAPVVKTGPWVTGTGRYDASTHLIANGDAG